MPTRRVHELRRAGRSSKADRCAHSAPSNARSRSAAAMASSDRTRRSIRALPGTYGHPIVGLPSISRPVIAVDKIERG